MKVNITKKANKKINLLNSKFGKKIKQRLYEFDAAETLDDMRLPAIGLHQLTGNRKGTWVVKLNKNYRLTFITVPEDFKKYCEVKEITVINCEDYH